MVFDAYASFGERLRALPRLGVGISTEFGAGGEGLDVNALAREHPGLVGFLEIGVDLDRGVDADGRRWVAEGRPTTYHFLDVNLEEREDLDEAWCVASAELAREIGAAWMCGDAGLWHVGPRDRGHGALLPPVLRAESAVELAENVRRLRELTGLEVLPENPPAHVYLGDLHLLDYFSRVADAADCGLLLDVAHLAIYQRASGHAPRTGLDGFPLERVVEVHVAGGTPFEHGGRTFVEDDHGTELLPETWELAAEVLERAPNLRAVVFECERNPVEQVLPGFERLRELFGAPGPPAPDAPRRGAPEEPGPRSAGVERRLLQRTLFRMQLDRSFADAVFRRDGPALASTGLAGDAIAALLALDPLAVGADCGGTRLSRLVGNVATEFARTVHVAVERLGLDDVVMAFPGSDEFHGALRADGSLPLAFADYLERRIQGADPVCSAFLTVESALARARRELREVPSPGAGEVVMSGSAWVVRVPAGTLAAMAALDEDSERELEPSGEETLLVTARPGSWTGALREVQVEAVSDGLGTLLESARVPLGDAGRKELARELGVGATELEAQVADLVAEGLFQVRAVPRNPCSLG